MDRGRRVMLEGEEEEGCLAGKILVNNVGN